jgi:hypothetical protein
MKELVAKINAEFEAFTAETELIDKGEAAGARARKSTLEMEKLLKERKLSIEESKIISLRKSP